MSKVPWKKVDLKRKLILLPGKKKEKEPFLKIQPVSISIKAVRGLKP